MCGIAGFIDSQLSSDVSVKTLSRMLERIAHRGPDARGMWHDGPLSLGHNRLSIVDLSESGNQPMHGYNFVITFNGEIYNYVEIRNELLKYGYHFNSSSDTEVVLAAYDKWGKNCVSKFVGMWSLAIWNKSEKSLFCSRDRFGIKPFYYINDLDKFYFASEYKALKETSVFNSDLNLDHVSRGLQLGWVSYHDQTYYSSLKALPAASNLYFQNGKLTIEKYWDINTSAENNNNLSNFEKREKFKELFLDSIKLHMRSDVEVGGCLSGGIDSSAIASCVAKLFPESKFKTFSIYYDGQGEVDERPWVNKVLQKYPSLVDFDYCPKEHEIRDGFEQTVYSCDVPITGSSPISQNFVMRLVKEQGIKVLLDGQGADEYLAGYMHSFYRLMGAMLRKFKFYAAFSELSHHKNKQEFSFVKSQNLLAKSVLSSLMSENDLYKMEYKNYFPFLSKNTNSSLSLKNVNGSKLNQFLYHLMTTTSLPSLLHFEDRNSMQYSIESRVPFLDHRLVEFAFSLPDKDKFSKGITKSILRSSMSEILPESILTRYDKKGFVTPGEVKWLRGPLKYLVDDLNIDNLDFLQSAKIKNIINAFKMGDNKNANLVWRTVVLNYWLNKEGLR